MTVLTLPPSSTVTKYRIDYYNHRLLEQFWSSLTNNIHFYYQQNKCLVQSTYIGVEFHYVPYMWFTFSTNVFTNFYLTCSRLTSDMMHSCPVLVHRKNIRWLCTNFSTNKFQWILSAHKEPRKFWSSVNWYFGRKRWCVSFTSRNNVTYTTGNCEINGVLLHNQENVWTNGCSLVEKLTNLIERNSICVLWIHRWGRNNTGNLKTNHPIDGYTFNWYYNTGILKKQAVKPERYFTVKFLQPWTISKFCKDLSCDEEEETDWIRPNATSFFGSKPLHASVTDHNDNYMGELVKRDDVHEKTWNIKIFRTCSRRRHGIFETGNDEHLHAPWRESQKLQ